MTKLGGEGGGSGGGGIDDTVFSEDIVEFTLGICEGPIAGLVAGPKGFFLGDTALVSPVGDNNFSAFQLDVYHGSDVASPIHNELGGISSSTNVGVTLASTVAVTRTTSPALRNKIDALEVRLVFNQLMRYSSHGKQKTQDAIFKIEYKLSSSATWLPFRADSPIVFNGKSSGGLIKEYRRTVPRMAGADWDIRVTKISSDDTVTNIVSMGWESFQCVTAEDRSYDGLAAVKGLAKASDQFSSIPVFQGIWAGKLIKMPDNYNPVTRFYNTGVWGGTLVTGHTDNGAWAVYDMLMNTKSGMKRHYPDLLTDRYSFYDAGKWCDALVPRGDTGTFQPRWTYNDVLDQPRLGIEQARYVAASFGGVLISDLNKTIKIKMDQPGNMVQIFGPESVSADGFQYQYSDISQRPNDINVSFISPELGWETDMRRVFDQSLIDANGRIPFEFIAVGCIDAYEAQRRAQNILIKANTEVTTVNFTTARQGMLLELYNIIGVSDPNMGWGLAGRIKSTVGTVINLRDALTLPVATDITMSIQTSTGIITRTVRAPTAVTKVLNITVGGALPGTIPARAQFTLAQATVGLVKPFRIVGIAVEASNPDMYTITALELNTNRFGDVDNMISSGVQEYASIQSKIPPAPVIQSVTSGGGQQTVGQDGTLFSDMEVQLLAPSVALSRMVIYYRAIGDSGYRHIDTLALNTLLPGVEPGETYEVYAVSEDITGNRSRPSAVTTHTVALRALAPAIPGVWTGVAGFDTIKLTGPAIPDVEIGQYNIYAATAASTALTLVGTTTTPEYLRRPPSGDAYTRYKVAAVSRSGVEGPPSAAFINVVPLTSLASTIPAVPAGLALATAFQLDNSLKVTATWTANTEANLSHYLVRVVEGGNTTITPSNTPRIDFSRFSGTTLQVSVAAVNKLGLASNFCTAVSVTTPVDTIAPAVPTGLAITPGFQTFWASWGASDDLDIHHYELYMATATTAPAVGATPTYISEANNFVVSGWTGAATQNFWVRAVDNAGNKSAWSARVASTVVSLDTTLPATAVPTGLALSSAVTVRADGTLVTMLSVSWSAVSGAASYLLSLTRAGASEIILPVSGLSYEVPVFPGVLYTAKIQSVNGSGLKSAQSTAVTLTPPGDTVAPAVPTGLTAVGTFESIWLKLDPSTEADLARYEFYESATTTPAPVAGTAATFATTAETLVRAGLLGAAATRYYWVRAVDTSGNKSAWSARVTATTTVLDTTRLAGLIDTTSFAAGLATIEILAALPATGNFEGRQVFLTTDNKLYRHLGSPTTAAGFTREVDGADLVANSVTTGSIAAGAIKTAQLFAGAVVASKMMIGDTSNIINDPDCVDVDAWTLTVGTGTLSVAASANNLASRNQINVSAGIDDQVIASSIFPVEPGKPLWVSAFIGRGSGDAGSQTYELALEFFSNAGGTVSLGETSLAVVTTALAVTRSGQIIAPATGRRARLIGRKTASAGLSIGMRLAAPIVRRAANGELIVDGAITADHVGANEIITNTANIQDAVITDAKITTLSAAKLVAGSTITGSVLVSGTALSTIESRAADPAARINAASTQINPGKIVISGATTLADWRGTDTTTINGGAIETDSISTRQIKIGALPNLIQNGDFSDTTLLPGTYWSTSAGTLDWDLTETYLGSPSLRMTKNAPGSAHLLYTLLAKQFPVVAGEKISLSTVLKSNAAAAIGLYIRVHWYDAAGVALTPAFSGATENQPHTTAWSTHEWQVVVPATAAFGEVRITNNSNQTTATILYIGRIKVGRPTGTVEISDGAITGAKLITTESVITTTAQIQDAVITDAKITTLSAAKLVAGSTITGSVLVSGTALSTIESRAADPAARINAAATQIDPGKIVISGATTLADWRGTDTTTINGGAIEANTIASNKLVVGSRALTVTGVQFDYNAPSANRVAWSAGVIRYINDAGTPTTAAITANAAGTLWSTGVLYIYWAKGATVLSTTTTQATAFGANNVVIATYGGGVDLVTDFGKTIIDGGTIKTGSVKAAQLDVTTAVITGTAQIANAIITTAKIADAQITTAKIGDAQITSAKIGNLQVDTLQIAGNAVTLPVNSFTAAALGLSTSFATVASVAITRTGIDTRVEFSIAIRSDAPSDGSVSIADLRLYRGATLLLSISAIKFAFLGRYETTSFVYTDTDSGSGATTYSLQAAVPSGGYGATVANRYIAAQQFKK